MVVQTAVSSNKNRSVLFRHSNKYFGIGSISNADAKGIKETIKTAFASFRISNFTSRLLGLNVDGASVNIGIHRGLGTLIKQEAPWLILVHCLIIELNWQLKIHLPTLASQVQMSCGWSCITCMKKVQNL